MRRRTRTGLVMLAALSLVGLGGWMLLRASSDTEFVSGALGAVLGRSVEIESVRLRAGMRLEIDLRGVEVRGEEADGPFLKVDRVLARAAWPRLLAGQFVPESWTLVRPVLVMGPAAGQRAGPPRMPVRPVSLTVRDGTLVWGDPANGGMRLTHVEASATSRRLPVVLRGTALGQMERLGRSAGSFSVEFDAASQRIALRGSVSGWDLSALAPPGIPLFEGKAGGTVSALLSDDAPQLSVDLDVEGLRLDHPSLREPVVPQEARVEAEIVLGSDATDVRIGRLQVDDLVVRGALRVEHEPKGRVTARLSVDPFRAAGAAERLQLLRLIGRRHEVWRRFDERTEQGEFEVERFELDVPRTQLVQTLSFGRRIRPRELQIVARIRDAVYRPSPTSSRLKGIEAEIRVRGNRLEVYDLRMSRNGEPLPEIDVTIEGLHRFSRLPAEERGLPAGPGAPTSGLGPAFSALATGSRPDGESTRAVFTDLRLGHPALVLPIRDATAIVSFPSGNLLVEELDGMVGGARATARALWDRQRNRVIVDLVYGDGEKIVGEVRDSPWLEGSWALESVYFGPWRAESLEGRVRAVGSRVEISEVRGWMTGGSLLAEGTVDLSQEGQAPVQLSLGLVDAKATEVGDTLELSEGTLEGILEARGSMEGWLDPEVPFLAQAEIDLEVKIVDGRLGNLPVTVTLARLASPTGWGAIVGRPLRFERLDMQLRTEGGTLHISDFNLQGRELRMLSAGTIDLMTEDRPIDLLVALLLFQGMDRVIESVPWIGDWVLGKDRNLVAFYFRLEGPWAAPEGRYIPPETLRTASGWAERLVAGGVRQIGKLLRSGAGSGAP